MNCLHCGKELLPREGKKKLVRKYCDRLCATRYKAREWYKNNKDKPEFKEKQKKWMKNWYSNNKERQNKNVVNDYNKHRDIWNERKFSYNNRKKITEYLNSFCSCGKPVKIIMHKSFGNYPKLKGSAKKEYQESNLKLIENYTKENLIGVCSRLCLEKEKRK